MTDVLNNIEADLEVAEARILQEFRKIQGTPSESGTGSLPAEFREEIRYTIMALKDALEGTGSVKELQLTTERHEDLRTRIYVINQLLDRKIAIAAFNQASSQLKQMASTPSGPRSAQPVRAPDQAGASTGVTVKDPSSILDSIRGFFRKKERQKSRVLSMDVEKDAPVFKEIYKEDGIYGAAQELAMLALVVADAPPPQKRRPIITGRASFEARDLSSTITDVPAKPKPKAQSPERKDIAQTPEEIRRKLEQRKRESSSMGKAVFESRDVEAIATDPQKIREKLASSRGPQEPSEQEKSGREEK